MPVAYSEDLRLRMAKDVAGGLTIREAAQKYSVSPTFAFRMAAQHRKSGHVQAKRMGGYKRQVLAAYALAVAQQLEREKGMTLAELRDWIAASFAVEVHVSSVDRLLRKLGFTYKKNTARQRTRPR